LARIRRLIFVRCGIAAFCATTTLSFAAQSDAPASFQSYPTKPIRLVTAATPGSGPEVIARHLAAKFTEAWGQQVVVDPRPGATGMISGDIVAKSAPDGYTLWFATSTQVLASMMFQRNWMARDYAPIGMLSGTAFAIAVNSSVPANTLAEFIAYARTRPGKLLFGSNGQGSTSHMCTELFQKLAGIRMVHVAYKGGTPTLVDLAGGQLQLTNGKGDLFKTEITDNNRKKCKVKVIAASKEKGPTVNITIAISLIKNTTRFEWFLEKATEIGVTEIIPLICARTEKTAFKFERMKSILVSAILQSQQTWLPLLHEPIKFNELVKSTTHQQKFIAHCINDSKRNLIDLNNEPLSSKIILIGPEGDFTAVEIDLALQNHFSAVSLGDTRLRTETAGIVAATLLRFV